MPHKEQFKWKITLDFMVSSTVNLGVRKIQTVRRTCGLGKKLLGNVKDC